MGDFSGFSVSGNYVANNGATPARASAPTSLLLHLCRWQLFYDGEAFDGNWGAQVGYLCLRPKRWCLPSGAPATADTRRLQLAAAWKPEDSGLIPSISTGYSSADEEG